MTINDLIVRYNKSPKKIIISNITFIQISGKGYVKESTLQKIIQENDSDCEIDISIYELETTSIDKPYCIYTLWQEKKLILLQKFIESIENDSMINFNTVLYDFIDSIR